MVTTTTKAAAPALSPANEAAVTEAQRRIREEADTILSRGARYAGTGVIVVRVFFRNGTADQIESAALRRHNRGQGETY